MNQMATIKQLHFYVAIHFRRSVHSAGNKVPPLAPECNSLWCYLFLPEFFLQWKMFVTNLSFIEPLFFSYSWVQSPCYVHDKVRLACLKKVLFQIAPLSNKSKILNLLPNKYRSFRLLSLLLVEYGCTNTSFKNSIHILDNPT